MPATHYKIFDWGEPLEGADRGVMETRHVAVAGVAKRSNPDNPYAVANELICGALAKVLLLPVPPGFIVEHEDEPYYVSLNFNLAGEQMPPANAQRIVAEQPFLAAGVVLFDAWIYNTFGRYVADVRFWSGEGWEDLANTLVVEGHGGQKHEVSRRRTESRRALVLHPV